MMRKSISRALFVVLLTILFGAAALVAADNGGGATVVNPGRGQPNGFCFFGGWTTTQMSAVRTPNGNGTLSCDFSNLPPATPAQVSKGFTCTLSLDGFSVTNDTLFVRTPSGKGHMTCQFN